MRASTSQIILAQESDFNLGGLRICPSRRQVVVRPDSPEGAADGRDCLQPRIMQVLVALARRRGEVVSRDEMMAACWGGFAVSDDAINRCIARLRRLSQSHGGFTLETIPRVGYQLIEDCAVLPESPAPVASTPMLSEAAITALLMPAPRTDSVAPLPAAVATPSWVERQGPVAAIAFAVGAMTSAAVFAGIHFL